MDPCGADPFNNPMVREMERLNRLNDELNWIDRIDRQINPLKHAASMLTPLERVADEVNSLERIAQQINPAETMLLAQEAVSKCIQEIATALPKLAFPDASFPDLTLPTIAAISNPNTTAMSTPEGSTHWVDGLHFPVERLEPRLTDLDFYIPESRSLAELQEMSDDEIQTFLSGNVAINAVQMARHVLAMRQLERVTRPHWTALGTFWSTVVFGLIGIVIGLIGIAIGAITVYLMMR